MAFKNVIDAFTWTPVTGHKIGDWLTGKDSEAQAPAQVPEAPASVTESAAEVIKKSEEQAQMATRSRQVAARRSRSIYSSPLGLAGEASTAKKVLLGQ